MFATPGSLSDVKVPKFVTRKALIIINLQNDSLYKQDEVYICKNHDFVGRLKTLIPYFRRIGDIIWVHTEMSQASKAPSPDAARTEEQMKENDHKSRQQQKVQEDQLEDDTEKVPMRKIKGASGSKNPSPAKSPQEGSPKQDYTTYHPSSRTKDMMQRASAQARADQRSANMDVFNDKGNVWEEKLVKPRKGQQKKFYVGGTHGAETLDELKPIVDETSDTMIIKQHYSAFDQTSLLMSLRMSLVTQLYICGSLTNVGVYSTAADAVQHGFEVILVEDCLGYRSEEKHEEAMRQMADIMGANGVDSEELIDESGGREAPDTEEPMFSGPGPDGISLGDLSILCGQTKVQLPADLDTKSSQTDDTQSRSQGKAKRPAEIDAKASQKPVDGHPRLKHPVKLGIPDAARKSLDTMAGGQSPLLSPGISSIKSRDSTRASRPLTLGPKDAIGTGDSRIVHQVLSSPLSEDAFGLLKDEVDWQTMHHRGGAVPRLVAVQGEIGECGGVPVYRHPADESPPLLEFSPTVEAIREEVEEVVGQTLNHALIQLYRGGDDNISEHSDKTLDVARGSSIVNLSLGAQRVMTLRTKASRRPNGAESPVAKRQTQRIPMPHNSAFILGPESNAHWLHGVRADKRPIPQKTEEEKSYGGERISITFRHIGTFMEEDKRKIWGQGARCKTKAKAGTIPRNDTAEMEAMVQAFGKENHQSDFDWDAEYGRGFDVINLINDKAKVSLCKDSVANLRVQLSLSEKAIPYTLIQQSRPRSPETRDGKTRYQPWTHGLSNTQNVIFEDANEEAAITEGDIAILFYLENIYPFPAPESASSGQIRNVSARTYTRTTQANELLYLWRELKAIPQSGGRFAAMPAMQRAERPTTPTSTPLAEFQTDMKMWEEYAQEADFIAGEYWTIIDCAFWPVLHEIANGWESFTEETYPRLVAYHGRVLERESIKTLISQTKALT